MTVDDDISDAARSETPAPSAAPAEAAARRPVARFPAQPSIRLTGRGAVLAIFTLSLAGALLASVLHVGPIAGLSYVAACLLTTWTVRGSQLLLVVVTPPILLAAADLCAQLMTGSGGILAAAGGTVVSLANLAPWLFTGTICGVGVGLLRGLIANVRDLGQSLRGDPPKPGDPPGREP